MKLTDKKYFRILSILGILLLSLTLSSATDFGYNNKGIPTKATNYSLINVNNSNFLEGYTALEVAGLINYTERTYNWKNDDWSSTYNATYDALIGASSGLWATNGSVIYNNTVDKVGIRTSTPGYTLHVNGTALFTGSTYPNFLYVLSAGTSSSPSYSFNGDSNTGIYNPLADNIGFVTGGTVKATINESGDVLITQGNLTIPNGELILKNNITMTGTNIIMNETIGIGDNLQLYGYRAIAIGSSSRANGNRSTAIGYAAYATGMQAVAVGEVTRALDLRAVAFGFNSQAVGQRSLAIGDNALANTSDSIALGRAAEALGARSLAIGRDARANATDSLAFGFKVNATSTESIVFGSNIENTMPNSVLFGGDVYVRGNLTVGGILNFTNGEAGADGGLYLSGDNLIGIGTPTPTQELEVSGNINMSGVGSNFTTGGARLYWDETENKLSIRVS